MAIRSRVESKEMAPRMAKRQFVVLGKVSTEWKLRGGGKPSTMKMVAGGLLGCSYEESINLAT